MSPKNLGLWLLLKTAQISASQCRYVSLFLHFLCPFSVGSTPSHMCRGKRTSCGGQFSPPMWVPGIQLRWPGAVAGALMLSQGRRFGMSPLRRARMFTAVVCFGKCGFSNASVSLSSWGASPFPVCSSPLCLRHCSGAGKLAMLSCHLL